MQDNATSQLARLTREEAVFADNIDWTALDITKEQAIDAMADKVIQQLTSINEDDRAIVAMATLCKLLVENLAFQSMLKNKTNLTEK